MKRIFLLFFSFLFYGCSNIMNIDYYSVSPPKAVIDKSKPIMVLYRDQSDWESQHLMPVVAKALNNNGFKANAGLLDGVNYGYAAVIDFKLEQSSYQTQKKRNVYGNVDSGHSTISCSANAVTGTALCTEDKVLTRKVIGTETVTKTHHLSIKEFRMTLIDLTERDFNGKYKFVLLSTATTIDGDGCKLTEIYKELAKSGANNISQGSPKSGTVQVDMTECLTE